MGWDPSIFIEHNLQFETAEEMVCTFQQRMQKDVFVVNNVPGSSLPDGFNGWWTWHFSHVTLEEEYREDKHLHFADCSHVDDEFWISRHTIMLQTDDVTSTFQRWFGTIHWFNELAKLTEEERKRHPFQEVRKNIYKWAQLFGGSKYILFCGDTNQDIEEELWGGSSIDDVLKKYARRIRKVYYPQIDRFHYDVDKPYSSRIYKYTVLIDDFEDLKG